MKQNIKGINNREVKRTSLQLHQNLMAIPMPDEDWENRICQAALHDNKKAKKNKGLTSLLVSAVNLFGHNSYTPSLTMVVLLLVVLVYQPLSYIYSQSNLPSSSEQKAIAIVESVSIDTVLASIEQDLFLDDVLDDSWLLVQ